MDQSEDQLSIFISYSHADKTVARALARALETAGARVWIDEGELRAGDSIIEVIATAIVDVDFVVAIVSKASVESRWCTKELALALTQGLGREGVRLLPLRLGDVDMPASLTDVYYRTIDPTELATIASELMRDAQSHREERHTERPTRLGASRPRRIERRRDESSGQAPAGADSWSGVKATGYGKEVIRRARATGIGPAEYARRGLTPQGGQRQQGPIAELGPLKLVGIVRDGIGRPRNDGSRGSALYAVPFRLSRMPTDAWARLLEATWDRPPEWTTMHRPGICRVRGDVVTLDGVTVEEVEKYHLKTLRLSVSRTNEETDRQERLEAAAREREQQLLSEHEATIDETVERLDFD